MKRPLSFTIQVILHDGVKMTLADEAQLFEFHPDGGSTIRICVPRLIRLQIERPGQWCRIKIEITPGDLALISERRGINPRHLDRISPEKMYYPGHGVFLADGSFLLVDGNHRYVKRASCGLQSMEFYVCRAPDWHPALIDVPASVALWNGEEADGTRH
jgi:hypothetical protein